MKAVCDFYKNGYYRMIDHKVVERNGSYVNPFLSVGLKMRLLVVFLA